MANGNDSGMGILGVVIGVLVVILVGGAILYGMGAFGPSGGGGTASVKIEAPKVPSPSK
jgi:hypothetical protein